MEGSFSFMLQGLGCSATAFPCPSSAARLPTVGSKSRKGKNFGVDEEKQLCKSWLCISQDPVTGNGQRNKAFWERITAHYNTHRPTGTEERPLRSLDSKWGVIKHDSAKFCGCYEKTKSLEISGTTEEDIIDHALDLYKRQGGKAFVFVHCWRILSTVPRWQDFHVDGHTSPSIARPLPVNASATMDLEGEDIGEDILEQSQSTAIRSSGGTSAIGSPLLGGSKSDALKRPQGSKHAKEEQRQAKIKEGLHSAQAKVAKDMAAASLKKAEMLSEAADLAVFNMRMETLDSDLGREFLALRRGQVMKRLQKRLAEEAAIEAANLPTASGSRRQRQRHSSSQSTLPTDDFDGHGEDGEGHGEDGLSRRVTFSEDIESIHESFSQSRRSSTPPIDAQSYEWPTFQMPIPQIPTRFGSAFTNTNHEVLAQAGFRAPYSPIPYSSCLPHSE